MKVIITGASGFVGRNLSGYLNDNFFSVQSLSLRDKEWSISIDKSADAIIHLAGKAHDTKNISNNQEYFSINTQLSKDLFDVFLASEMKCFFYFSSVKAIADSVEGVLDENTIPNPLTSYGCSKLAAEQYLLQKSIPAKKKIFIIRPCMIHGPGNKGNLNLLYKIVEKGLPWPLAAFHNERSFLGIDNLDYLIHEMLIREDLESGIYNFSDDQSLSTNQLISIINKVLRKKAKFWKISRKILERTAGIGDRLGLPLNSERLKKLTESYVVSNEKIKTALGIDKLPLSAEEGLIKTINSFKNTIK